MNFKSLTILFILGISTLLSTQAQPQQLIKSNDEVLNNAPFIEFLTVKEGQISILDESFEPYFSNLQEREIQVFTGFAPPTSNIENARNFARTKFASAVTSFTEDEKASILFVITEINQLLNKEGLNIITHHPWKLIKIEDWLCGGFAHTRGNYIILSQKHLDNLTQTWSENMSLEDQKVLVTRLGGLLVHEQFHCLQRTYKPLFDSLYTSYWGFVKITVEPEKFITVNQISNPDAPIPEWAFTKDGNYYWVRTLIKEEVKNPQMGIDFTDVVFALAKEQSKFTVQKDAQGNLKTYRLSDFPE